MATDVALYLNDIRTMVRFVISEGDDHGELLMDLPDLLTVISMLAQAAVELSEPMRKDPDA